MRQGILGPLGLRVWRLRVWDVGPQAKRGLGFRA